MKIVVIGYSGPGDEAFVCAIHFLLSSGWDEAERCLDRGGAEFYDMASRPELGDGIDAVDGETELVVALHLYGMKGQDPVPGPSELYNRNNASLLPICKRLRIPLLVVGEQPSDADDLDALYVGDEVLTL